MWGIRVIKTSEISVSSSENFPRKTQPFIINKCMSIRLWLEAARLPGLLLQKTNQCQPFFQTNHNPEFNSVSNARSLHIHRAALFLFLSLIVGNRIILRHPSLFPLSTPHTYPCNDPSITQSVAWANFGSGWKVEHQYAGKRLSFTRLQWIVCRRSAVRVPAVRCCSSGALASRAQRLATDYWCNFLFIQAPKTASEPRIPLHLYLRAVQHH